MVDNIQVAVRLRPLLDKLAKMQYLYLKKTHFTNNIFCYHSNDNFPPPFFFFFLPREKESEWIVSSQKDCIIQRGHPSNKYFFGKIPGHFMHACKQYERIYIIVKSGNSGRFFHYSFVSVLKKFLLAGCRSFVVVSYTILLSLTRRIQQYYF